MKSEQNQTLKNLGFTLFSIQMMQCMVSGSNSLLWAFTSDGSIGIEFEKENYAILLYIGIIIFFAQYSAMIFLLFYRLKVVFDDTAYELSQYTKWAFYIMYTSICGILLAVSFHVLNNLLAGYSIIGTILVSFAALSAIAIIFFLAFLFVTKLIDVNKRCDGQAAQQKDDNKLLSTITKQSILTLISIASLLAYVIIYFLLSSTGLLSTSIHASFIHGLLSLIDTWTNFICILLSYKSFNAYYTKMCGCCDIKCKELCSKFAKPQKNEKIQEEIIESMSGQRVQCA